MVIKFSRRKIKRPLKSNPPQDDPPEFFKIYLPEHNSQKLLIPPCFLEHFNGEIPEKLWLKTHGKFWEIELEKTEHRLFLKKGWESYVNDNSLERGTFLVFVYDGDFIFTVKVFGVNGCKKNHAPEIRHQLAVNEPAATPNQEMSHAIPSTGVEQASKGQTTEWSSSIRFARVDDGKKRYELHIPGGLIREFNITPPENKLSEQILLRDHQSLLLQTAVINQRHDGRVVVSRGRSEFYVSNKICRGDEYEFEIVIDEGRKVKEMVLVNIVRHQVQKRRKL